VIARDRLAHRSRRHADPILVNRGWRRPRLRYPASEKLDIIRLVEGSHLPVKHPSAGYNCCDACVCPRQVVARCKEKAANIGRPIPMPLEWQPVAA